MSRRLLQLGFVALAGLASLCASCDSCRGPMTAGVDASQRGARSATPRLDAAADVRVFGPSDAWGDGSLPTSTATGPEAEATHARLSAARASIGFWRVARDARAHCPTIAELAATPAAMFDRDSMGTDAWGTPLEIECQGASVHIRSLGPDRQRWTPDDIIEQ